MFIRQIRAQNRERELDPSIENNCIFNHSTMNDSFLEDLELIPDTQKQVSSYPVDRHVTTRAVTSSPLQHIAESRLDNVPGRKSDSKQTTTTKVTRRSSDNDLKKQPIKGKVPEKREKPTENKLKQVENKVRLENRESTPKDEAKSKLQDIRMRSGEAKVIGKDRSRRSGSYNSKSSDLSMKENSRPSDSSKDSNGQVDTTKEKCIKCLDCYARKSDTKEKDPVALLNAIKDLISTYTKQESTKILRAMQELHVNSQASLIKNLLCQTDDLVKEMDPSKNMPKLKILLEQNNRLQNDVMFLRKQNEELKKQNDDLQRRLEELEVLKQQNVGLKIKCKELAHQ